MSSLAYVRHCALSKLALMVVGGLWLLRRRMLSGLRISLCLRMRLFLRPPFCLRILFG